MKMKVFEFRSKQQGLKDPHVAMGQKDANPCKPQVLVHFPFANKVSLGTLFGPIAMSMPIGMISGALGELLEQYIESKSFQTATVDR